MRATLSNPILLLTALLVGACAVEPDEEFSSSSFAVTGANDSVTRSVPDEALGPLPLCSTLVIDPTSCILYEVEGSGGLFAYLCSGVFVCIGDAADISAAVLAPTGLVPGGTLPGGGPGPGAAPSDGTDLEPDGASMVGDGNPIPASS